MTIWAGKYNDSDAEICYEYDYDHYHALDYYHFYGDTYNECDGLAVVTHSDVNVSDITWIDAKITRNCFKYLNFSFQPRVMTFAPESDQFGYWIGLQTNDEICGTEYPCLGYH